MEAENSAVRAMRLAADALIAGDIASFSDALAGDYAYEDRRKGLQLSHGKSDFIEHARVIFDLGLESYDLEVLETRGDRAALYRQTWHVGGFEVVGLLVGSVDAEGKAHAAVMFDGEDLGAARAELEVQSARY